MLALGKTYSRPRQEEVQIQLPNEDHDLIDRIKVALDAQDCKRFQVVKVYNQRYGCVIKCLVRSDKIAALKAHLRLAGII